jgi:8-oxo-dGTP pyrophosphatase MutT (NUDIX family)
MAEGRIRVISLAVILRPSDQAMLAIRFPYARLSSGCFYRAPGGGVEFGEESGAALQREMIEELGHAVHLDRMLGVIENIFSHNDRPHHEVAFQWLARFDDSSLYDVAEFPVTEDNGDRYVAEWVHLDDLAARGIPLFPVAVAGLIRGAVHG